MSTQLPFIWFVKSRYGRPDLNLFKIFEMTFSNFQILTAIFWLSLTSPALSPLAFLFRFGKDKNNLIIFLSQFFFWRFLTFQIAKIHGKTDSKLISWLVRELFEWAPILETTKNDQKYKMFIPVLYTILIWRLFCFCAGPILSQHEITVVVLIFAEFFVCQSGWE